MNFKTYKEAADYRAKREAEMGKMKFRSTAEYAALYPKLTALYKSEGHVAPKRRLVQRSVCLFV